MNKKYKYVLYVNGVNYDYFYTIKEIDYYLFERGIDTVNNYIEIKKI